MTAFAICANPVTGLERVVATSQSDSSNKFVDADCPAGKRTLGTGAELTGGGGQVVLDFIGTQASVVSTTAHAKEDEDGTTSNWTVRSFAICAASAERKAVSSGFSSEAKSVFANCPPDLQASGLGGDITNGAGQVRLGAVKPFAKQASAFEDDDGTTASWAVQAYSICSAPPPGLEHVTASSGRNSSSNRSATATCPAGKRVISAGGEQTGTTDVVLNDVRPNPGLTAVTAQAFEDEDGFIGQWRVFAFAACANPPAGLELVSATTEPDSDFSASVAANCPSGKNLLGTGAEIGQGLGQVGLDDLRPHSDLINNTVTAIEDQNGTPDDWTVTAHAICANP